MTIEAMKQALEALEMYVNMDTHDEAHILEVDIAPKAITALRTAIAEAEKQEPVAWGFFFEDGEASNELFDTKEAGEKWLASEDCLWAGSIRPLYTTPQPQEKNT